MTVALQASARVEAFTVSLTIEQAPTSTAGVGDLRSSEPVDLDTTG
jgi:hypothetical protein